MVTVSIHSKLLNMSFALRIIFYFNFEFVTKIFKNKIVKALFVIYKWFIIFQHLWTCKSSTQERPFETANRWPGTKTIKSFLY